MPPAALTDSNPNRRHGQIWQRWASAFNPGRLFIFAIAYLIAYGYGSFSQTSASPLWFPDSVLLCALLLTPINEWWMYLVLAVPIRFIPTHHPSVPLWFVFATSANDLLKAILAAYLLRRLPSSSRHPSTLRQLATFFAIAVFLTPVLSAFAGAATRYLLGYGFWVSWYQWFLGDALANLVITPALLYWSSKYFRALIPRTAELTVWTAGFSLALMIALWLARSMYSPIAFCIPIPFLIWAATRFGLIGASTSLSAIALLATARIAEKGWLFSTGFESKSLLFLQLFLFVVSIPILCIATVIEEKGAVERNLRESEQRLRLAVQAGRMFAYSWDASTDFIERSGEYAGILGVPIGQAATGTSIAAMVHPDDKERLESAVAKLNPDNPDLQITYRIVRPDGAVVWLHRNSRAYFDEHDRLLRIVGMIVDVTQRMRVEEALRATEERLRLAQQAACIGTFDRDVSTGAVTWSTELESMYGLSPGAFDGTTTAFFENLIHPDDRQYVMTLNNEAMKTGKPTKAEWRIVWGDGSIHWIAGHWQVFMNQSGDPARVVGVNIDITDRKLAEQALANMTRKLIESQEQERARIGRELHDDINQRLAMLSVEAEQLRENPSEIEARVQSFRKQIGELSTDVQGLSHDLHSSKLEYLGAVAGMKSWCKEIAGRQKLEIEFRSDVSSRISAEVGVSLLRLLQEAVHNALKHSGTKRIEVQLREESNEIHLAIADSGRGFDVKAALEGNGLGLTSMRERVRLVNGRIAIDSTPMRGTRINIRVPLGKGADSYREAV
jgi:PAS domain S-box-containing protein